MEAPDYLDVAHKLAAELHDGPELTTGLRHLWDAKNNLVAQRVIDLREADEPPPVNSPEPYLLTNQEHHDQAAALAHRDAQHQAQHIGRDR